MIRFEETSYRLTSSELTSGSVAEWLRLRTLDLKVRGLSARFLANNLRQATYAQEFSVHQAA